MIQTRGHIVVGQEKIKHLFLIFIVILVLRRGYIEINLSILYRQGKDMSKSITKKYTSSPINKCSVAISTYILIESVREK